MDQLQKALKYIDSHEDELLKLWENMARIESQTADMAGVDKLAAHLDTYCTALGLHTRKYSFEHAGPALAAWTEPGPLPPVALMGHMDTVHPKGSFGPDAFQRDGDIVRGPGVYDCKGGIAVAFFVIRALIHAGYDARQLKLLLIGDEETAHGLSEGESLRLYREEARDCAAAFNCESGLLNGDVITCRKGGGVASMKFRGIASHAGVAPDKGASAIREAAHKILDIEALTDFNGTTFNCGTVSGGSGANVIPDSCQVNLSFRFHTNRDQEIALEKLRTIAETVYVPGVTTELILQAGFQAMEPTEKTDPLFELYRKASEDLGFGSPNAVDSGGCSDGAYVAMEGVPVLCGVGVRGANNHSREEYAVVSSLKERAKIITKTILDMPEDF